MKLIKRSPSLLGCLLILLSVGCASAPTPQEPGPEQLPDSLHFQRNSAEYRALMRQTFRLAGKRLEKLAEGRSSGAWAVALDVDETVLDNSEYDRRIIQDGVPYHEGAFDEWCNEAAAPPIPGAREFLEKIHEMGGIIALVSNRRVATLEGTRTNLERKNLPFDIILLKDQERQKEPRWRQVEEGTSGYSVGPVQILMWVGDNIKDFPDLDQTLRSKDHEAFQDFGGRFFIVPNPVYGSWKENPQN